MKLLSLDIKSTYLTQEEYTKLNGTFLGKFNDIKYTFLSWINSDDLSFILFSLFLKTIKYFLIGFGIYFLITKIL